MEFHPIDGYLLDGRPAKAEAIDAVLRVKTDAPAAQPFYRALEAVGARAADEALIALRLVIAGKPAGDDAVRRVRSLAMLARGEPPGAAFVKAGATLRDLEPLRDEPAALAAAARAAYRATF